MLRRVAAASLLAALLAAPSASAIGCPPFFKERATGYYDPRTGEPISICQPYLQP